MKIRKGKTIAHIGTKPDGTLYTAHEVVFPSINAAKKANGLNSRTARGNEQFPPKLPNHSA